MWMCLYVKLTQRMRCRDMNIFVFGCLSVLVMGFALASIFCRHLTHNILSMVVAMLGLGAVYAFMGLAFLAAVHVIVYAGAIMVLFLYAIMLMNLGEKLPRLSGIEYVFLAGVLVLLGLFGMYALYPLIQEGWVINVFYTPLQYIGEKMFGEYLLYFESTAFLFLSAIIGIVRLTKKETSHR